MLSLTVRTVKIGSMYALCRKVTNNQIDQIGLFFKGLGSKIYIKLAEMFGDCYGYFEKGHFLRKKCYDYILSYFWKKIGQYFFPTSWSHLCL